MDGNAASARARLEAWRQRGVDRLHPVRFHRIDALARRAALHDGALGSLLESRLASLVDAFAHDLAQYSDERETPTSPDGLRELVAHVGAQAEARDCADDSRPAYPELAALADVRVLWAKVRADSQLRQSLEQSAEDAGPLNSGRLVHRALTLMREVSPGYLAQFMSYIDTMTWLEQMKDAGAVPVDATSAIPAPRKRAPRKRKA